MKMRNPGQAATRGALYVSRVKSETRSFYELAVQGAICRISAHLDEALDLAALARAAGLSPFHFHRIFRGMVGETPLELQRRLRMERAAWRVLRGDLSITSVAFDAGYETHESFTRAFRNFYGVPPSGFRPSAPAAAGDCSRPPQVELAAASGIHFSTPAAENQFIPFSRGAAMNVTIKEMPELRLGTVRHIGPYQHISEAFQRLGAIAGPAGLISGPAAAMIGVYHDDPETTPPEELRSDAALAVSPEAQLPEGLVELRLPAGRYASMTHVGPYTQLGDAWARFMGEWLPNSGHRVGVGMSYEIYRNTPLEVPPAELRTEIYLPLA